MTAKKQTRKSPTALESGKATLVPENRRKIRTTDHGFGLTISPMVGKATQFKPGVAANPGGRPKSHGLLETLRAAVDSVGVDGKTLEEHLVEALIREALNGRNPLPAIALVFDRLEGRSAQLLNIANVTPATGTTEERINALLKLAAESEGTKQ